MPLKMSTNADLGHAITRLREERDLSVESLADIADCTPAWLSDAERGTVSPRWSELGQLADALDVPIATLIEETERETRAREA